MITRDEAFAFFARRHQLLGQQDAPALANLHTEDGLLESPFAGGVARGRDAIEAVYRAFFETFTIASVRQEDLLVDGARVTILFHMDGSDRGGIMGLPPTGRSYSLSLVSLCDFRDGLIAQERRIYDFTGLLVQIGALKAKPI